MRLSPPDADAIVELAEPVPGDGVTTVEVALTATGLDARWPVDLLDRDLGVSSRDEHLGLGAFLRELGRSGHAWGGTRGWRSLDDVLGIEATCDQLGRVTFQVELRPVAAAERWRSSAAFEHRLGDLADLADAVDGWLGV